MSQTTSIKRRRTTKSRIGLEQLEPRLLCAAALHAPPTPVLGPFLTLLSTSPPSGAILNAPPDTITLKFDRPLDPGSLFFDVVLTRLNEDGSVTSVFETGATPDEAIDSAGNGLVVSLNQSLPPGHYQIFLSGLTGLMGSDGSMLDSDGSDKLSGDFFVVGQHPSLADAADLGTPGSVPTTFTGALDFKTDPTAIVLGRIVLPANQFWRLGLEVTAQRDGSPLDSALSLFDSQGNVIATADRGRRDFPADPFLFVGLPGGTYYIGISGVGNLPDQPNGYDLVHGSTGSVAQTQPGGAFTLHLVADPVARAISLRTFNLDRADPLDQTPTGLTLGFSGVLQTPNDGAKLAKALSQAIEVVDQNGRVWPVTAMQYNEANAQISFLFNDRLPAGRYTVRLPSRGGLVDLAGLSPVAAGQAAGVLGTFQVDARSTTRDPHDFGALLPNGSQAGIATYAVLNKGDSVTYRFVVTYPGKYSIQALNTGGGLSVTFTDPHQTYSLDPAALGKKNVKPLSLEPGVYFIRLTSSSRLPILVLLNVSSPSPSADSLLANGIGQGSALNLRLIVPAVLTPDPAPHGPTVPPTEPQVPTPSDLTPARGASSPDTPFVVAWATISTSSDFAGRPRSNRVSPVGAGGLALALENAEISGWGSDRPGQSLMNFGPRFFLAGLGLKGTPSQPDGPQGATQNGAMIGAGAFPGVILGESTAFDQNWLDKSLSLFTDQANSVDQIDSAIDEIAAAAPELALHRTADVVPDSERVEQASVTWPIGVGLIGAFVLQYRLQIRRWLARLRGRIRVRRSSVARTKPGSGPSPRRLLDASPSFKQIA